MYPLRGAGGTEGFVKVLVLGALLAVTSSTAAAAQDATAVVADAARAMGVNGLKGLTFGGSAAFGNFGQSRTISFGLASTAIPNYIRTIDFERPASLATGETRPPQVRGGPPPEPGTYVQNITPADAAWAQQLQIWTTPWGFLIGAASHRPTMQAKTVDDIRYRVVSWVPDQKAPSGASYRLEGFVNDENLLERVNTWVEHPIMGDLLVETRFVNYQDAGGLKVPAQIRQSQGGMETFVVSINSVRINPDNLGELMTPPPSTGRGGPRGGGPGTGALAPAVASEKLAEGVYRITGGYVSLAVEFKDYVVVLEAGQNEARGLAVLAETRRLFPKKRIKYVVNTHAHFDHAGGLPPFVAEGITVIADDNNKYFLLPALGSPRTLVGDALAKSRKQPVVEGVEKKLVLRDATRTLELHHVEKLEHSDGMLIAYLPKEKILFTADFPVPVAGQPVNPSTATLIENITRLGLDFDRYVTVHAPSPDRPLTRADLMAPASR
jgi:glyoxylase-like metal-dependent hydrolase (beta-lactamase superfamily II)